MLFPSPLTSFLEFVFPTTWVALLICEIMSNHSTSLPHMLYSIYCASEAYMGVKCNQHIIMPCENLHISLVYLKLEKNLLKYDVHLMHMLPLTQIYFSFVSMCGTSFWFFFLFSMTKDIWSTLRNGILLILCMINDSYCTIEWCHKIKIESKWCISDRYR